MYLLLKRPNDNNTSDWRVECRTHDIATISKEIERRVKDGCPAKCFMVVEEIPFGLECVAKYGEDLRSTDAK